MEDIGRRLRELRQERGQTITGLANRADLTPNAVSRIELGSRSPSAVTISKLARALAVKPGELFEDPKSSSPAIERGELERINLFNDYADSWLIALEDERREFASVMGDPEKLERLRVRSLMAYRCADDITREADAMEAREGETKPEREARERVLDAVHKLFLLARFDIPEAIAAANKPPRENATVTRLEHRRAG